MLFSTISTFGQQFLWTTDDSKEEIKFIPYNNVTDEVLELYDLYEYYYDFSGYTKESFFEEFKYFSEFSKIKDKTVIAFKKPSDKGSLIYVISIDKDRVDMVGFTNALGSGLQPTYHGSVESHRKRFEKWFKTLLN